MKMKIIKYLNNKEENQYTVLDDIFKKYLDGSLEKSLKEYGFSNVEVFTQIKKGKNYLQLNFRYYNLIIDVEFDDLEFDYCIYASGISADDFEKNMIRLNYENIFNLETFFSKLYYEVSHDKRLRLDE